jgi:hypothetical protein
MRIVNTDNFGSDYPNESFVLHRMNKDAAEEIAEVLNKHFSGPMAPRYWKVVEDDYVLAPGFEP